jgi:hypothetical protein
MNTMGLLLHGFMRRCVLMGCLLVVDLHVQVVEKALHGVRWEAKRAPGCVSCLQHRVKIERGDGGLGALLMHRYRASCLPAGFVVHEPLCLLDVLVILDLLYLCVSRLRVAPSPEVTVQFFFVAAPQSDGEDE